MKTSTLILDEKHLVNIAGGMSGGQAANEALHIFAKLIYKGFTSDQIDQRAHRILRADPNNLVWIHVDKLADALM